MQRIPNRLLRAIDAQQIEKISDAAFADAEFIRTTEWAAPELWFVERVGDAMHGCVGVVWREISVDDVSVRVGGICNLVVVPEARGTGLARRLVDRALEEMRAMPVVAAGMLHCEERLAPLYERLGWRRVTVPVRCMQHGSEIDWRAAVMTYPLVPSALDTARQLKLNGLPW